MTTFPNQRFVFPLSLHDSMYGFSHAPQQIVSEHAVLYIERMLAHNPGLRLTMANAHRVLLAAAFVAMKYSSDDFYETTYISKVCFFCAPSFPTYM